MDVKELLSQYWYVAAIFIVAVVGSIVYAIFSSKKGKRLVTTYLGQYPDAVKVYLTQKALVTQEAVQVILVDGEAPAYFREGGKTGFYVKTGETPIMANYTYTRPGVMYKNVTKSTGNIELSIETEQDKEYIIGFDRKKEEFTFEEIEKKVKKEK